MMLRRIRCYAGGGLTTANLTDALLAVHGARVAVRLDTPTRYSFFIADRLTYADLQRLTAGFAAVLAGHGVGRGARVGIVLPNGFDIVLWCLAAMRLGAAAVPLNARLKRGEIGECLESSGATAVVVDDASRVERPAPQDIAAIEISRLDALPPGAPAAQLEGPEPCAILFTSGTTGLPKAAVHSSRGLLTRMHLALLFPATRRSLVVTALPVSHIMGLVATLLPLVAGVPVYFIEEFEPERVLRAIAREHAMLFAGVPAMFRLMADTGLDRYDLRSVRAWISASDSVPAPLVAHFKRHGALLRLPGWHSEALFVDVYGSVELGGAVLAAMSLPGTRPGRHGMVAFPLPQCRVRVADAQGRAVGAGALGELYVRTPSRFRGYVGEAIETSAWVPTGDLARTNRLGGVRIVGRAKDVIKCGGYSVQPLEIERVLAGHPEVRQAVAFGVPHPVKGEAPVAAVVPVNGCQPSAQALLARCRTALADYKVPRQIVFLGRDELPLTASSKVIRAELAARFARLLAGDDGAPGARQA